MTSFQNVNMSVALNNNISAIALGVVFFPPVFPSPGQYNNVTEGLFMGVICIGDPNNPYWGAAGNLANVGVKWSGPVNGQVILQILQNATTEDSEESDQTVAFTAGKWSDCNIATLEETAAGIHKRLDDPDGDLSDEIRDGLAKVLDAIETELKEQLSK